MKFIALQTSTNSFIFPILFNKIGLRDLFRPIYIKKESKNKPEIVKFIINKRYTDEEIKNYPHLDSLIKFFENYKDRIVTIDKIDDETYRIVYTIKTVLTLQCALTLDPVLYEYEKKFDEVYSKVENDEYFLIEKNTIDLTDMVWTNILIEKPINVTLPNAYEIFDFFSHYLYKKNT